MSTVGFAPAIQENQRPQTNTAQRPGSAKKMGFPLLLSFYVTSLQKSDSFFRICAFDKESCNNVRSDSYLLPCVRVLQKQWKSNFVFLWLDSSKHSSLGASRNYKKRILASFCLSVLPSAWNNWAPTGQISLKFCVEIFSKNFRTFKLHYNVVRIRVTLH